VARAEPTKIKNKNIYSYFVVDDDGIYVID
jgi:hypothetical protein